MNSDTLKEESGFSAVVAFHPTGALAGAELGLIAETAREALRVEFLASLGREGQLAAWLRYGEALCAAREQLPSKNAFGAWIAQNGLNVHPSGRVVASSERSDAMWLFRNRGLVERVLCGGDLRRVLSRAVHPTRIRKAFREADAKQRDLKALEELKKPLLALEEKEKQMLEWAIEIGGILSKEKAGMKDGEWLPWCRENLQFSEAMARRYMAVHRDRESLQSSAAYRMWELLSIE